MKAVFGVLGAIFFFGMLCLAIHFWYVVGLIVGLLVICLTDTTLKLIKKRQIARNEQKLTDDMITSIMQVLWFIFAIVLSIIFINSGSIFD